MSSRILHTVISYAVLPAAIMCSQVQGETGALRNMVNRPNEIADQYRILEDSNVAYYDMYGEDAMYAGNATDDSIQYDNSTIKDSVVSKVQQYKTAAESKAWEFYESPPSEWTEGQWNFFFGIFGSIMLTCCFASMCCAYCCWYQDDDATVKTFHYRPRYYCRRNKRDDDIDDRYKRYHDESTVASESVYGPTSPMSISAVSDAETIPVSEVEISPRNEPQKPTSSKKKPRLSSMKYLKQTRSKKKSLL